MIADYADHAANERTFLAWVRTAMSVVGFGLAIARLGNAAPSPVTAAALLASGAAVIVIAYVRMRLVRRRIKAKTLADDDSTLTDAMLVGLVLALFVMLGVFALHVVPS